MCGGRSSAKVGAAEGRGRGVSPDVAGNELGSGVTALLCAHAPQLLGAEEPSAFTSCRAHSSGGPPGLASPCSALVLCEDDFCRDLGGAGKAGLVPSARHADVGHATLTSGTPR